MQKNGLPIDVTVPRAWLKVCQEVCGFGEATPEQHAIVQKELSEGKGSLGPVHAISQAFNEAISRK